MKASWASSTASCWLCTNACPTPNYAPLLPFNQGAESLRATISCQLKQFGFVGFGGAVLYSTVLDGCGAGKFNARSGDLTPRRRISSLDSITTWPRGLCR